MIIIDARGMRAALVLAMLAVGLPAASARAEVVALEGQSVSAPALWNGGVAWWGRGGIRAATPGASSRLLAKFPEYGSLAYSRVLDAGSGAGTPSGSLAYGWEEANTQTPPMGPGDTKVPSPPIPYESSVDRRGLIASSGSAVPLPQCDNEDVFTVPGYDVSLAGSSVAYGCVEPNVLTPAKVALSYVAVSNVGALAAPPTKLNSVNGTFQLSGSFAAFQFGEPFRASKVVVENLATSSVAYETPSAPATTATTIALQSDGTVVLLGQGTSTCSTATQTSEQSYPAEWFSVTSPTPHQLGCFYDGALRPVGGQWVALAPGPGSEASLVLVDLASGTQRTLASFPDAPMVEPARQALAAGEDFDGVRLTWTQETCGGDAVELAPEVGALIPGALPSLRCPVKFQIHGALRPNRKGVVRVRVVCPLGCQSVDLTISHPRALRDDFFTYFSLPAATAARVQTFRLSRRELAYVKRHHRVPITLVATIPALGGVKILRFPVRAVLAG